MDADVAEPLGPGDPREIGQFTIIGVLGAGGMGEVYLGTREGRYVAVKRVKPRLVSGERFNREVAILHRVPFGVAPSLLASDSTAPEPWFATEYVPGLTVDDAVRSYGPLTADALWLLLAETAAHLQAVHEAGIVHRDLKPANIMLVRDGVKLIDFGIALAGDQARLTRTGASSGTRGFTAPEQEAGDRDVSERADLYSLAATLVYAASARLPGALPDVSTIRALDPALAAVVEPCLAADPAARPTAAELVATARGHADAVSPSWPAPVMERIAKRRAFAATPVSVIDTVLPPDLEVATEPEPGPTQGLTDNGEAGGSRRPRFLIPLAAVAAFCVAVAGVLAALSSHGSSSTHSPSAASGIGIVPIAGTESSSASAAFTSDDRLGSRLVRILLDRSRKHGADERQDPVVEERQRSRHAEPPRWHHRTEYSSQLDEKLRDLASLIPLRPPRRSRASTAPTTRRVWRTPRRTPPGWPTTRRARGGWTATARATSPECSTPRCSSRASPR